MENGDETLASPTAAAAAEKAALNGDVTEEEQVRITHPAKSYAAVVAEDPAPHGGVAKGEEEGVADAHTAVKSYAVVAARAEIEDLSTIKLDLEEMLAEAHLCCRRPIPSQITDDVALARAPGHRFPHPPPAPDGPPAHATANKAAQELVRKDKLREVHAGHDGTWAAHPGLIPAIREVFEGHLGRRPNQIGYAAGHEGADVRVEDLIQPSWDARTVDGLRLNVHVGVQDLTAWLAGSGFVPLYNLMEDAATAEIRRVQNWQWLHHDAVLDAVGVEVRATPELLVRVVDEEMARVEAEVGHERFRKGRYVEAV